MSADFCAHSTPTECLEFATHGLYCQSHAPMHGVIVKERADRSDAKPVEAVMPDGATRRFRSIRIAAEILHLKKLSIRSSINSNGGKLHGHVFRYVEVES